MAQRSWPPLFDDEREAVQVEGAQSIHDEIRSAGIARMLTLENDYSPAGLEAVRKSRK
jgi:hypothetical protein